MQKSAGRRWWQPDTVLVLNLDSDDDNQTWFKSEIWIQKKMMTTEHGISLKSGFTKKNGVDQTFLYY